MAELDNLKARLANLGVQVKDASLTTSNAVASAERPKKGFALKSIDPNGKPAVANLLDKINRVEMALNTAESLTHAAQGKVEQELAKAVSSPGTVYLSDEYSRIIDPCFSGEGREGADQGGVQSRGKAEKELTKAVSSQGRKVLKKRGPVRPKSALTPGSSLVPVGPPRVPSARTSTCVRRSVNISTDRIPAHTPLASVLQQYRESETTWAQEKAALRREADTQRRRANHFDEELKRLSRLSEHRSLDIKALKSALRNRDNQLVESGERIKELEAYQEDAAVRLASLSTERDDLKALLIATLQRLEAVDEVVHRADMTSSIMQEKVKELEEERLRALEAAALARSEVQELTESKRKLQWQSKLLEKMSEVQLKHNKHKTEAIKKLLSDPPSGGGAHDVDDDELDQSNMARANHRSHVTFLEEMTGRPRRD
eukprot:gene16824-23103_t